MDGVRVSEISWVRPERGGNDYVDYGAVRSYVFAPVFSDFVGKSWESEYPRLLAAYYAAVRGIGLPGDRCGGDHCCDKTVDSVDERVLCRGESPVCAKITCIDDECTDGSRSFRVDDSVGVQDSSVCSVQETGDAVFEHSERVTTANSSALGENNRIYGVNYERNKKNREQQKVRKAARRAMGISAKDWRVSRVNNSEKDVPAMDRGFNKPAIDSGSGFWNSCSADVRQELIDSKARMHIADNNKKTHESERRLKHLQSPEQLLKDAMRMVDFANEQAKKENDSKVCGWAKTVAESYAQTIARSAPTSVESFDEYVKSNTSVTSVSIEAFEELKAECEQLKIEYKTKCDSMEKQIQDLLSAEKKTKEKTVVLEQKQEMIKRRIGNSMMQDICAKVPSGVSGSSGRPVLSQEFFLKVQAEKRRKEASGFYEMK